jgi:hypothetical protein
MLQLKKHGVQQCIASTLATSFFAVEIEFGLTGIKPADGLSNYIMFVFLKLKNVVRRNNFLTPSFSRKKDAICVLSTCTFKTTKYDKTSRKHDSMILAFLCVFFVPWIQREARPTIISKRKRESFKIS